MKMIVEKKNLKVKNEKNQKPLEFLRLLVAVCGDGDGIRSKQMLVKK